MKESLVFRFPASADAAGVEDDIALAIFSAECVHGRPQTRLEVCYELSPDGRDCRVDVTGPAGEPAVRVLVGLAAARFGEAGFSVERKAAAANQ